MAKDVPKIFGCPNCGYRVEEADASCPRCNTKITPGTKLQCPFCGELVDPSRSSCPSCHVDYAEFRNRTRKKATDKSVDELLSEIIRLESTEIKQEDRRFACPKCSWLLKGTETSCPKCGNSLMQEFAFQCPVCGNMVASDSIKCAECGTSFDASTAQVGPPPPVPPTPEPRPDLPPPEHPPGPFPEPEEPEESDSPRKKFMRKLFGNP